MIYFRFKLFSRKNVTAQLLDLNTLKYTILCIHAQENRSFFKKIIVNFDEWLGNMIRSNTGGDEYAFAVMAHMLTTNIIYVTAKQKKKT